MIPLDTIVQAVLQDLGIATGNTDVTAMTTRKVTAAWAEIERWCNQPLVAETGNVTINKTHADAYANGSWLIDYFPVQGVASVAYTDLYGGNPVTIDAAEYTYSRQRLRLNNGIWAAYEYTITLTVGHDDIPPDIADLCGEMARLKLRSTTSEQGGISKDWLGKATMSEAAANQPVRTTALVPMIQHREDWQERLAAYRRLP